MVLLLQSESFWLLSIPEKPKLSGIVIGSVSAIRSYFSQTDFFSYFSNWSSAYERHYQYEITRHNELRNEETKKVNRIFFNIILDKEKKRKREADILIRTYFAKWCYMFNINFIFFL